MKLLSTLFLLILLTCAFLLSRASGSQEGAGPKEAKPQSKQSPLQKEKAADQPKPIEIPHETLSQPVGTQPNQISAKPETEEHKPNATQPADSGWLFNLLLVIFTGVLAGLGVMQAAVMKRQATYMRRSNRRTREAAEAAIKAANVAAAGLKADRPYLLIENVELSGVNRPRESGEIGVEIAERESFLPMARITFRNFGKGPALIDTAMMRFWPMEEIPDAGDFTLCRNEDVGLVAVGADKTWTIKTHQVEANIPEKDYEPIVNGTKMLYLWGCIRYKDVFEHPKPYETAFCWYLRQPWKIENNGIIHILCLDELRRGPSSHNYTKSPKQKDE